MKRLGSSFGAAAAAYAEHRPDYERDAACGTSSTTGVDWGRHRPGLPDAAVVIASLSLHGVPAANAGVVG